MFNSLQLVFDSLLWDSLENPVLFDIFTSFHIFSGFIGYIILHKYFRINILKSFIIFSIIHLLYELKDFYYSYIKIYEIERPITSSNIFKMGYHANNSYLNSISDQIIACLTFLLVHNILKK